jgi:hypothetical protein
MSDKVAYYQVAACQGQAESVFVSLVEDKLARAILGLPRSNMIPHSQPGFVDTLIIAYILECLSRIT